MNMNKKLRGLLSLWLAAILVFSMLPVAAMAEESAEAAPVGTVAYFDENQSAWYTATDTNKVLTGGEVLNLAGGTIPEGYHFDCWKCTFSSGFKTEPHEKYYGGEVFTDDDVYTSFSLGLAAQWALNTYNVHFNGNGATGGATTSQKFDYDKPDNLTPNGFKREYTVTFNAGGGTADKPAATVAADFAGWAESADGSVRFADNQSVTNLSKEHGAEITLYAKWSDMSSVILPAATKADHDFAGWYTDAVGGERIGGAGDSYTPAGSITLYAHWISDAHTVTFDVGGHGTAPDAQPVSNGDLVTRPADPSEDGYTFGGWFTDALCSTAYDFSTPVTGDLTLYAKWTKLSVCKVTFLSDGVAVDTQEVISGQTAADPSDPVKDGYIFKGWYTDDQFTAPYDFNSIVTTDMTLYALWEKEANDGVGGAPDSGSPAPAPEPEPEPETKPEPAPDPEPAPEPETVYHGSGWQPVSQTFVVSISGDEKMILENATLNNKIATISNIVPAQLDTVIDVKVKTGLVKIDFSRNKRELDGVKIPTDALKQISEAAMDSENDTEGVEIIFTKGMSITLDAQALNALVKQAKGKDVTFFFKEVRNTDLTSLQKKTIVNQTAYDISILSNDAVIGDFVGFITIQAPYTLKANETAENISVSYVDENGAQVPYETSYDSKLKTVSWVTDHLSVYMVAFQKPVSEKTYTVQKGDTLYAISQKFGCTVEEIMKLNRALLGDNSILIYEGWELQLP